MLISRGCSWVSMKRGGCKFGGSKTGAVHCPKGGGGAVVSQLEPKLRVSAPPPPPPGGGGQSQLTPTSLTTATVVSTGQGSGSDCRDVVVQFP